jgi:hypothetical protein
MTGVSTAVSRDALARVQLTRDYDLMPAAAAAIQRPLQLQPSLGDVTIPLVSLRHNG